MRIPGDRHRRSELLMAGEAAEKEAETKDQEIRQLKRRLRKQREQNTNLEWQLEARQDPQA